MLSADYATTAALAMLAAAGVAATVGVIGLAAFNAKVRNWLEETTPSGEGGYRLRGCFRTYLAGAGAVAILVPLAIIVGAGPMEIFWLQTLGRPPLSYIWSFLIVLMLIVGTIIAVVWLVFRAMQTGADLAQEIREQQSPRDRKGSSVSYEGAPVSYAGTSASSAEGGEGSASRTLKIHGEERIRLKGTPLEVNDSSAQGGGEEGEP